jgi:hypothetical protein
MGLRSSPHEHLRCSRNVVTTWPTTRNFDPCSTHQCPESLSSTKSSIGSRTKSAPVVVERHEGANVYLRLPYSGLGQLGPGRQALEYSEPTRWGLKRIGLSGTASGLSRAVFREQRRCAPRTQRGTGKDTRAHTLDRPHPAEGPIQYLVSKA